MMLMSKMHGSDNVCMTQYDIYQIVIEVWFHLTYSLWCSVTGWHVAYNQNL